MNYLSNGTKKKGKEYKRYNCEAFDVCGGQKEACTSAKGGRVATRLKGGEVIDRLLKMSVIRVIFISKEQQSLSILSER